MVKRKGQGKEKENDNTRKIKEKKIKIMRLCFIYNLFRLFRNLILSFN